MKKAKKKKKKTNKKIKNISIIVSLGILVILLAITIYFLTPFSNDKEIINNTLSGTERMDAQTSLVNIVKTYLNEEKIKEYVNNNNIDKLTISDLRDNFAIDIQEFEDSEYECDINGTSIKFENNFDNQTIMLSCKAFLLD